MMNNPIKINKMENTNFTIHIFGYGETQINSDYSFKDSTDKFVNVAPLVDAIYDKKPVDSLLTEKKYHAINIFNRNSISWQDKNGFSLSSEEVDDTIKSLIDNLSVELKAAHDTKELDKLTTIV